MLASYLGPWIKGASSSNNANTQNVLEIAEYLHQDKELLVAAETGNAKLIKILIRNGVNIQELDNIGRNALHLAVCTNSLQSVVLLLEAGVETNVKDNVGMTPLSLCLMRRPSVVVANLLFDYGARILPRTSPMDTGLFLQFAIMCTPTTEEAELLRLLIDKGARVNDLEAPGGRQALHFAAMSNNCILIKLLTDLGADCSLVNHRNETPKQVACTFKCREAELLLEEIEESECQL